MREIKFNFVYGIDGEVETYFTKTFNFGEIENGCHWNEISDSPLLKNYSILAKRQYTGLKDRNGTDIYEGDIIYGQHDFGPGGFAETTAAVQWDNINGYQWNYWDLMAGVRVIGNIYENPDLLSEPVSNFNKLD